MWYAVDWQMITMVLISLFHDKSFPGKLKPLWTSKTYYIKVQTKIGNSCSVELKPSRSVIFEKSWNFNMIDGIKMTYNIRPLC